MTLVKAVTQQAKTVNQQIFDRFTMHAVRLHAVENGTARKVRRLLFDAHEDVLEQLQGRLSRAARLGYDPGPVTTKRLRDLAHAYDRLSADLMPQARALIASDMREVAVDQAQFELGLLDDTLPIKFETILPATSTLNILATQTPFQGRVLSEWTQNLSRQTKARFNQAVKIGLVNGESVEQIGRRLRGIRANGFRDGVLGWQRYEAQTLARTAVSHAANQATDAVFRANSRLMKGQQWSATLDTRTCPICGNLDGRLYKTGETHPEIPIHFSCRCRMVPAVRSFRDLGIPMDDLPEGMRASMNGDVPGATKYPEWLRRQTREDQLEALGPTRLKLFNQGKEMSHFVNRQNRVLTIAELRRKERR